MSMRIEGLRELLEQTENLGLDADRIARDALPEAAQPICDQAKANVHNRSGTLSTALAVGPVKKGAHGAVVTVGVHRKDWTGDDFYYAAAVEFGHGGPHPAPPHPYLQPAFDAQADESYNILREKLAQAIK